jgi:hypothetical protein
MTSAQFLMNKIMDKEMCVSPNYACMTLATCVKVMGEIASASSCGQELDDYELQRENGVPCFTQRVDDQATE